MTFERKETLHYSALMPKGCTVNSETDRGLWLDVDKPRANEVAKILRAIADSLDEVAKVKP